MAYWEREEGEWRVRVYRRIGRPPGEVSLAERSPSIPPRMVAVVDDTALHRRHTEELTETERAFSRDARGGAAIGDAFARYGDPDAANVGNGAEFIRVHHGAPSGHGREQPPGSADSVLHDLAA